MACQTLHILLAFYSCILWTSIQSVPLPGRGISAKDQNTAVNYLTRLGYLSMPDPRAGRLRSNAELREGIKMFQLYTGLPMTGVVDKKTMEMMAKPRCGMPDFGRTDSTKRRRRYAVQGTIWQKKELTYMNDGRPRNSISETEVEQQVDKAFAEWERVSTLKFIKSKDKESDILLRFESGMHDDGYPFDGPGGTLAHGFYPHDNTGLAGDVHFDDDETWILKKGDIGTDFYWTALHEIGHALGLDHSNYQNAVMYPFYTGFKDNLQLNEDDVKGIRYLYGMPVIKMETAAPSVTMPTAAPGMPHACSVNSFDAIFVDASRKTYFLHGKHFWIVRENVDRQGPFLVKSFWPELPSSVDAAYYSEGNTTFFKGESCWIYNGTQLLAGPVPIHDQFKGLDSFVKKIDAAFIWGANGKTYLFSGDSYWKYNQALKVMDMGYPAKINVSWTGVPSNLDSALTWINGRTYFFQGTGFWIFDNVNIQTKHTEPMMTRAYWMKCRNEELDSSGSSSISKNFTIPIISLLAFILNYVLW
ncbi:72 kDa type IV collagenase-like [Dendronephthya gigantea]|uniref:72 kDa type IV collagenase-like n=1 Tax=Dendronephthya gigantea TaxID=151771 RepID=UPI00106A299C|nr:72 kDa type IV collagenase-like [Dendronephthya gigantea]